MGFRKRQAFGQSLEPGIAVMEWELGSRVTAELLAENMPIIGLPTLKNRMGRAFLKSMSDFIGSYVMLKGMEETENVYYCERIRDKEVLICAQVWPEEMASDQMWTIHKDLIQTMWKEGGDA